MSRKHYCWKAFLSRTKSSRGGGVGTGEAGVGGCPGLKETGRAGGTQGTFRGPVGTSALGWMGWVDAGIVWGSWRPPVLSEQG